MDQPTTEYTGRFIKLMKSGHWEYVDRVNAHNAAIILAVTADDELLLVEQYRIPLAARTIELPAGVIGDEPGDHDESAAAAAGRELLEETGYAAGRLEALTTGPSCSGLTSERVTLFRATDLKRMSTGGGVAGENITVHAVPLAGVSDWLSTQAFTYFQSKGGFSEGTPDDLPPARREKYDQSGRKSKVLIKKLIK